MKKTYDYYCDAYYSWLINRTKQGRDWYFGYRHRINVAEEEMRQAVVLSDEGQAMVREKLLELRNRLIECNRQINELYTQKANDTPRHDWLHDLFIAGYRQRAKKVYGMIRRFKNFIRAPDGTISKPRTSFDVDTIKQVPITTVMDRPAHHGQSGRDFYHCPFHQERTPSFVVYKDQNTYHCFGCQAHGDVIDLYMRLYRVDFIQACTALSN